MPYEHVREVLKLFRPYIPSGRSICGIIDLLGIHAEGVLDRLECEGGEVVVVQVDGRGMPRIQDSEQKKRCRPHKKRKKNSPDSKRGTGRRRRLRQGSKKAVQRRKKGQKAKNTKRVTVGVIYALNRQEDGTWEGPFGKFVARFGKADEVFKRLRSALKSMGEIVDKVYFISDGAPEYQRLRQNYLPEAVPVIDFYHVCEYLWKAGGTIYREGTKKLSNFVERLKGHLRNGQVERVLRILRTKQKEIPSRGPGTKGRRKRMRIAINYIDKRKDLMPYKELRELQLEIGSGVIESTVRQVVVIRFDGPGMRWGPRAQLLLHVLCLRLSDGWAVFCDFINQWARQAQPRRRLTPQGVNEGAKPKTAAQKAAKKPKIYSQAA
jgi:hypothetical protein